MLTNKQRSTLSLRGAKAVASEERWAVGQQQAVAEGMRRAFTFRGKGNSTL